MSAEKPTKATFLLLAVLSVSAVAASAQTLTDELANRSGKSPAQVTTLLASCDANQTSMKFCAWRDELATGRIDLHGHGRLLIGWVTRAS